MRSLLAFVVASAAACSGSGAGDGPDSGGGGGSGDGGAQDAMPDGPDVGTVNVIVAGWAPAPSYAPTLAAGVSVVFYKLDGTIGSVVKTDAAGHASATIERGSLVLVVNGANRADVAVDGAIASPGDTLRFGPDAVVANQAIGTLTLSWPARVFSGYTTYYYVMTPCGGGETTSTSMSIPLSTACVSGPFDVAVSSRRSSQGTTGLMVRRGVVPAASVSVSLSENGATWGVASTTSIPMESSPNANDPEPIGQCNVDQRVGTLSVFGGLISQAGGACTLRMAPNPELLTMVDASYGRNLTLDYTLTVRHSLATGAAFDGSGAMPWITSFAFSPATRTATWTSAQPVTLDASSLRIETTGSRYLIWRVFAPHGLPSTFTFPQLPADLAMWEFSAADTMRASLTNTDVLGATADDLLQHNLYYDSTFASSAARGQTARTP